MIKNLKHCATNSIFYRFFPFPGAFSVNWRSRMKGFNVSQQYSNAGFPGVNPGTYHLPNLFTNVLFVFGNCISFKEQFENIGSERKIVMN